MSPQNASKVETGVEDKHDSARPRKFSKKISHSFYKALGKRMVKRKHPFVRYIASLVISVAVLMLAWVFHIQIRISLVVFLLFIPILLSALYGGLKAGILSTSIMAIGAWFAIFPLQLASQDEKIIQLCFLIGSGLIVSTFAFAREKAEEALRQAESFKSNILKFAPFAILSFNEQGVIQDSNSIGERMFGYSRTGIKEKGINEIIAVDKSPAQDQQNTALIDRFSLGKELELKAVKANGTIFPVAMVIKKVDADGIHLFVGYILDISKRKSLEEKLEQTIVREHDARVKAEEEVRAREEFLSLASHELKTPLTSMLLKVQSVLHNVRHVSLADFSIERMMQMLQSTESQSKRLAKMINDLLNVSLISTGRLDLELEKADLREILQEVATRFSEQLERVNCKLTLDAKTPIPMVLDSLRIEQVITNLLSNAIKYGKGHPIHITLEEVDKKAILSVKDQGIGIPAENLERIFGRFERAVASPEYKGLGVGLFIAAQIVKAHEGKIYVNSKEGTGSEFTIELPIRKTLP